MHYLTRSPLPTLEDRIVDHLAKAPATRSQLCEALDTSRTNLGRALATLLRDGSVSSARTSATGRGRPTQLLILMHADAIPELRTPATLTALQVVAEHKLVDPEKAQTLIDAWIMATLARNAIVLVRGKRVDQLPQPGPQLAQVAGAAGWNPEDSQEFLEHYLRVTRRARKVVDEVFWGEVISEHDDY